VFCCQPINVDSVVADAHDDALFARIVFAQQRALMLLWLRTRTPQTQHQQSEQQQHTHHSAFESAFFQK
jgi:hypothetical protein